MLTDTVSRKWTALKPFVPYNTWYACMWNTTIYSIYTVCIMYDILKWHFDWSQFIWFNQTWLTTSDDIVLSVSTLCNWCSSWHSRSASSVLSGGKKNLIRPIPLMHCTHRPQMVWLLLIKLGKNQYVSAISSLLKTLIYCGWWGYSPVWSKLFVASFEAIVLYTSCQLRTHCSLTISIPMPQFRVFNSQ